MSEECDNFTRFRQIILSYYAQYGRTFSWRKTGDPYRILVSEMMLQQTQTDRVVEKFAAFISTFSTLEALAQATFKDVLAVWKGLGYNRRALMLHQCAQEIVAHHNGKIPTTVNELIQFKGIGTATASAVCAFAYNQPVPFIETNIRSVFIHFFFSNRNNVHDKELMPLIEKTVCKKNPRIWYYALMDYGVMLKKTGSNPSRKSAHHTTQKPFKDSDRYIRGKILELLLKHKNATLNDVTDYLNNDLSTLNKQKQQGQDRLQAILNGLIKDKLITLTKNSFSLS